MSDIDLSAKAEGRIIWQYRNDPRFRQWVDTLPGISAELLQVPAQKIVDLINVDNAVGEQLEICGRIVGIPDRPSIQSANFEVFAYNGVPGAQPYGVAPYKGRGTTPPTVTLPDYLFRLLIRAKIIKNTSQATIDDVKRGVEFILGGSINATVVDLQDMTMRVILGSQPAPNVITVLELFDVVTRPQGVLLEYVTTGNFTSQSGEVGGDPLGAGSVGGAQ